MKTEVVTKKMLYSLITAVGGISAMVCGLYDVDLSKGRGILDESGKKHCLWTKEGYRITITVCSDGGLIASKSKEVDPEAP